MIRHKLQKKLHTQIEKNRFIPNVPTQTWSDCYLLIDYFSVDNYTFFLILIFCLGTSIIVEKLDIVCSTWMWTNIALSTT